MFNFENFSKNKMRWLTIIAYTVYFLLAIVAPVMTICIKYKLFSTGVSTKLSISGWAMVLLLIVGVVGVVVLKKAIQKIPDTKLIMARFKYTLKTISNCVPPAIALYAIHLFEVNLQLACSTGYWLAIWFLVAALFDGILITSIDRENLLREKAAEKVEVEKRVSKI